MGVADSPLRERVVFVEGAARSGTTLLALLLLAHPEVGGTATETHLFDYGVGTLFDNFEDDIPHHVYLAGYLRRDELVDRVREFCDAVLGAAAVGGGRTRYVLEKTPAAPEQPSVALARKHECYPDAWYVHIVRNRDDVARSAVRAGWSASEEASARRRDEGVRAVREELGTAEHYLEVSYEALVADPVAEARSIFEWLGLSADAELTAEIALLARERVSQIGRRDTRAAPGRPAGAPAPVRRALRGRLRARARAIGHRLTGPSRRGTGLEREFVRVLQQTDGTRLAELCAPTLSVVVRTAAGDTEVSGAEAIRVLLRVGAATWGKPLSFQSGVRVSDGRVSAIFFSGIRSAERVDGAFVLGIEAGLVTRVFVLSVGDLGGRPLRELQI